MNAFSVLGQEGPEYREFWGDTVGMEVAIYWFQWSVVVHHQVFQCVRGDTVKKEANKSKIVRLAPFFSGWDLQDM